MVKTVRLHKATKKRTADEHAGRWFQGIVDLRSDTVSQQTSSAAAFVAERLMQHSDRVSLAKSGGRYAAFCGRTPHVSIGFMAREKANLSPQIDKAVGLLAKNGGDLLSIEQFSIRLRLGKNRANLSQWLESEREPRKADVAESEEIASGVASLRKTIRAILSNATDNYDEHRAMLIALSDAFRQEISQSFEPVFNEQVQGLKKDSYDEKKAVAKYANAELRRLGLGIRCPTTGEPAILQAYPGNRPDEGRFRLDYTDADGRRRQVVSWMTLPDLALMPASLTRVPYGQSGQRRR